MKKIVVNIESDHKEEALKKIRAGNLLNKPIFFLSFR